MFTTLVLTQDSLILAGNAVQGTLNSVLLWQTASTAARRSRRRARGAAGDTSTDDEQARHPWGITRGVIMRTVAGR